MKKFVGVVGVVVLGLWVLIVSSSVWVDYQLNMYVFVMEVGCCVYELYNDIFLICFGIFVFVFGVFVYFLINYWKFKGYQVVDFYEYLGIEIVWMVIFLIILVLIVIFVMCMLVDMKDMVEFEIIIKVIGY